MPSDQVLAVLRNASAIRIESPRGRHTDPLWVPICDGQRGDKILSHAREDACQSSLLFSGFYETMTSDPSVLLYSMEALFRGCGLYASSLDQSHGGLACGKLGLLFHMIGNDSAARAVWEQAPGCYSLDNGDSLVNGCMRFIVGGYISPNSDETGFILMSEYKAVATISATEANNEDVYRDDSTRLTQMARVACTQVQDRTSCQFLSVNGEKVNMVAVEVTEQRNRAARKEAAAEHIAEIDRRNRESDSRRDTILSMLQSMPGASDPNAIVNAGNQRAAPLRLATQGATLQTTSQRTNIVPVPATTYQNSAQVVTSSGGPQSNLNNSNSAIQYSTPLATSCVRQFLDPNTYNWLSFENNCGQAIYVTIIFHRSGGWAMTEGMHLAAGNHRNTGLSSGEIDQAGGFDLYVCPTDSVPVDLNGNVFNANVSEYRCKPT
jgi:hypothetical protein